MTTKTQAEELQPRRSRRRAAVFFHTRPKQRVFFHPMRVQLPRDPRRMGSFQVPGFQQPRPTPPASGPPRRTKAESTACGGIVRGYRSSARRGPHRIRSPITTSTPGTRNRPRNAVESDAGRRILSFRSGILTARTHVTISGRKVCLLHACPV